jgi:FkbM family methyltransferase
MDDKCIPIIKKNLQLNNCDNAVVNWAAVADMDGVILINDEKRPNSELMFATDQRRRHKTVPSVRLDTYFGTLNKKPDVIKIDAEGAEYRILKGMPELLSLPRLRLFVEVHCSKLRQYGATFTDVLDLLCDYRFQLRKISAHRSTTFTMSDLSRTSCLEGNVLIFASR